MNLVSDTIESYCLAHSKRPSAHCEAIEEYTRANVPMYQMVSGPMVGSFLGLLVKITGAKRILEVGTFTGYSALVMAEQLPEGGELITLDVNPETNAIAKGFWAKSPHGKKIRSVIAPALETMKGLNPPFDMVFIDADKKNYLSYLKRALELTPINGLIVVDNCLWSGRVVDNSPGAVDDDTRSIREMNDWVAANPGLVSSLLPIRDGLNIIRKRI